MVTVPIIIFAAFNAEGLQLEAMSQKPLTYFITPRCAIPILSRVVFFTRYIISSA
jgi:hypothetical protein